MAAESITAATCSILGAFNYWCVFFPLCWHVSGPQTMDAHWLKHFASVMNPCQGGGWFVCFLLVCLNITSSTWQMTSGCRSFYLLMAWPRLCSVLFGHFFSPLKWHHQVETPRRCQPVPLNLQHFLLASFFYTVQQYFLFITYWPDVMTHIKANRLSVTSDRALLGFFPIGFSSR